jgi:hypothetical protein
MLFQNKACGRYYKVLKYFDADALDFKIDVDIFLGQLFWQLFQKNWASFWSH